MRKQLAELLNSEPGHSATLLREGEMDTRAGIMMVTFTSWAGSARKLEHQTGSIGMADQRSRLTSLMEEPG